MIKKININNKNKNIQINNLLMIKKLLKMNHLMKNKNKICKIISTNIFRIHLQVLL